MNFSRPEYLVWLWLVPPSLLMAAYASRRKLRIRKRLAGTGFEQGIVTETGFFRLFKRRVLFCISMALFFIAMAGPEMTSGLKPVRRRGADLVFLLDVSRSMLAGDIAPDRLSRAKSEILQVSRSLGEGRRSLVLFAATPVIQCPMTTDQELFETLLAIASPDQIESQGTVYRRAFDAALNVAGSARREGGAQTVMVLAGDGEDHAQEFDRPASEIKKRRIRLYAIGIGSGVSTSIPVPVSASAPEGRLRDADGRVVMTRYRPEVFQEMARETGGRYFHSLPDAPVAAKVAAEISREEAASRWVMVPANRRPIHRPVIAVALVVLAAGLLSRDVSRRSRSGAA